MQFRCDTVALELFHRSASFSMMMASFLLFTPKISAASSIFSNASAIEGSYTRLHSCLVAHDFTYARAYKATTTKAKEYKISLAPANPRNWDRSNRLIMEIGGDTEITSCRPLITRHLLAREYPILHTCTFTSIRVYAHTHIHMSGHTNVFTWRSRWFRLILGILVIFPRISLQFLGIKRADNLRGWQ